MNDQNPSQWQQLAWRRNLSEAEAAELQRMLATDAEAREEFQNEAELNDLLERLPEAPAVASNFTAQVLQAVAKENAAREREQRRSSAWRGIGSWLPKAAMACVVVGFTFAGYQRYEAHNRAVLAQEALAISSVLPASPEVVKDVEPILSLNSDDAKADTELLALMK
jgi:anti-sigma factor RsiW